MERASRAHDDLRGALVRAVRQRTVGLTHPPMPQFDAVAFTRGEIEPMVRGLFPRAEQELVLSALAGSVVFLANTNIEVCANAEPRVPRGDLNTLSLSHVRSTNCRPFSGSARILWFEMTSPTSAFVVWS